MFHVAEQREVLFGGAAGPGKSSALLQGALEFVDRPSWSAVIFRRTYPQLEGSLIERSREWLHGTPATYNEQLHQWRFPSGARLKFAHMAHEDDRHDYQSAEFQYIGFDELTQFTERQYTYLLSRLRRTVEQQEDGIPLRMRAASNPGGIGHDWVRSRFVEDDRGVPVSDPEKLYIPARLIDNPFLDAESYIKNLGELDAVTKAQLLNGDWKARFQAGFIQPEKMEIVDEAPKDGWYRKLRYWDLASTDPAHADDPDWTAGALWGKHSDGFFYLMHVARWRRDPGPTEDRVKWYRHLDGDSVEVHMEQEPGSSGKIVVAHFRRALDNATFMADPVTGKKIERAKILAAQVESERVRVVRGDWNREFFAECDTFPTKGLHDDQIDAASGGISKLLTPSALEYVQQEVARAKAAAEEAQKAKV